MNSRRGFLGAAAAALALPATAAAEGDPEASDPGVNCDGPSSPPEGTSAEVPISARLTDQCTDGHVLVRPIRYTGPDGPLWEAELEVGTFPLNFLLTVDATAARDLRDALRGDRGDGDLDGEVNVFSVNGADIREDLAVSVVGDQVRIQNERLETTIDVDAEAREELVDGLDHALSQQVIVE